MKCQMLGLCHVAHEHRIAVTLREVRRLRRIMHGNWTSDPDFCEEGVPEFDVSRHSEEELSPL